jgi:hypothetical protein
VKDQTRHPPNCLLCVIRVYLLSTYEQYAIEDIPLVAISRSASILRVRFHDHNKAYIKARFQVPRHDNLELSATTNTNYPAFPLSHPVSSMAHEYIITINPAPRSCQSKSLVNLYRLLGHGFPPYPRPDRSLFRRQAFPADRPEDCDHIE